MVTIGDVAKAAGVSRSTVSYALTGNRPISEATRERINDAIRTLGFTPNAGARALATSQTMVLGLFLQFFEDEFSPATLQYILPISNAAREAGYDILMATELDGAAALKRLGNSNMVDGMILLNVAHDDDRLPVLRELHQPGALIGVPRDHEGVDVFDLDFEESARMIIDHLHQRGHRDVLLITPNKHVFERGGGYSWRFRDSALARASHYGMRIATIAGETEQPAIGRQVNRVLDDSKGVTGIVVHNDAIVAALPSILHARNIRVPEDMSVIGAFSEDFGKEFSLPYTAVETSPDKLGRLAVQSLIGRLGKITDDQPSVIKFVPPTLVDRGSTR